jgi:hypothetical protein
MYHVAKSSRLWHKHCIDICFTEECGRHCDGRWDVIFSVVSGLADVARVHKTTSHLIEGAATRSARSSGFAQGKPRGGRCSCAPV